MISMTTIAFTVHIRGVDMFPTTGVLVDMFPHTADIHSGVSGHVKSC